VLNELIRQGRRVGVEIFLDHEQRRQYGDKHVQRKQS
jgi:hypothetical protein